MRQDFVYAQDANDKYRFFKYSYGSLKVVTDAFSFERAIDSDLVEAILRGDLPSVDAAIAKGANVKAKEDRAERRTPIMFAALQSDPTIVAYLVNQGADVCELEPSYVHLAGGIYTAVNINNTPIAKVMLQSDTEKNLEKQPWYAQMSTDFKNRVQELRNEIERPHLETAPSANRTLYRFKYGCALAAGVLAPLAGTALLGFSAITTLCATSAVAFGVASYELRYGKGYTPTAEDISKGFELLWNEGVKNAIVKICNASKYGSPHLYQDYCYEPIGVVAGNSGEIIR